MGIIGYIIQDLSFKPKKEKLSYLLAPKCYKKIKEMIDILRKDKISLRINKKMIVFGRIEEMMIQNIIQVLNKKNLVIKTVIFSLFFRKITKR